MVNIEAPGLVLQDEMLVDRNEDEWMRITGERIREDDRRPCDHFAE